MITAKILADSVNLVGDRLVTYQLTYPRFIHSELMTHRVFSRNASSSRAVPITKMMSHALSDPVIPLAWKKSQPGMGSDELLPEDVAMEAEKVWLKLRDACVSGAAELYKLGVAKETVNRVIEPWSHITVLLSGTDFDNFFKLRVSKSAQPEICELATQMLEAYLVNTPNKLNHGEWHNPFPGLFPEQPEDIRLKAAVAHCARVSYNTFDKQFTLEDDIALFERLVTAGHLSPLEHVARVEEPGYHGNFHGFTQLRKMYEPVIEDVNLVNLLASARC